MPKKLSAKVQAVRDNMLCGNPECGVTFKASDSQALHFYYEKTPAYCSPECKSIGMGKKISELRAKQERLFGPCPTCGEMFPSKDERIYCKFQCWIDSPEFAAHVLENARKANATRKKQAEDSRPLCPVCSVNPVKPGNQFCSTKCYRQHRADLFDQWVANPQNIEELQGFDEYLSQGELPCLVEGCGWKGRHLSVHLNVKHGILAADFKRMVGFNISTGLVAPDLRNHIKETRKMTVLQAQEFRARVAEGLQKVPHSRYVSKENMEHRMKAYALRRELRDQTDNYLFLCQQYGEEPQYIREGMPDYSGVHATELRRRFREAQEKKELKNDGV